MLYVAYHRILDDTQMLYENSERTKQLLANLVEKNQFQHRYIKKFLGSAEAEELLKKLHAIYEDSQRRGEARTAAEIKKATE